MPSQHGSPLATIQQSIHLIQNRGVEVDAISPFFETEPVPASGQPNFINAVIAATTVHECEILLRLIKDLEVELGRQPAERWSARTIDIDMLAYGEDVFPDIHAWTAVVNDPDPAAILEEPVVPHPRLHKRAFVLAPLNELLPQWRHPVLGQSVEEMMQHHLIVEQMSQIKKLREKL